MCTYADPMIKLHTVFYYKADYYLQFQKTNGTKCLQTDFAVSFANTVHGIAA